MIDRYLNSRTRAMGQHASDREQIGLPKRGKKILLDYKMTDGSVKIMQIVRKTLTISYRIYNSILLIDILQIIFDQMYFYTN